MSRNGDDVEYFHEVDLPLKHHTTAFGSEQTPTTLYTIKIAEMSQLDSAQYNLLKQKNCHIFVCVFH